ncbi:aldehyde dehydrogenase family protein, partial [Mycobacterium tuberculosis]|nr:aldehyde dehydrogenase family protein [Mycobacterium tuberculosis]
MPAAVTDPTGRESFDPATGAVVGRTREGSPADIDAAVLAAAAAQPAWASRPVEERNDLLNKAADAIEASAEALAELLSREQGKPLNGPNARFEVGACAARPLPWDALGPARGPAQSRGLSGL